MPRSQCEKENVQLVQELAEVDGPFESPINLNFRDLIKLELPALTWNKPDAAPKKMKVTNTGHTVIVSGKWKCERPYLTGGPLDGKYVFSQIHFHWGPDNCKGSEHQVSGESFPLEMHVAHFKTEYMTQESALREKDGMVVIVYLFRLQDEPNNSLKKIINALSCIRQPNTSQQLEYRSILALCNPFTDDYFMYWGSVVTSTCAHILLWIVCREPFGISREQMEEFRKILDTSQQPIRRNSREPQPLHKRNVFHVNASRRMDEPMLPIKNIHGCFCSSPSDGTGRESKKSGDGGCGCDSTSGPQEEFEGVKQESLHTIEKTRGNGMYLQQTVYCQHATVHSVPALAKRLGLDDSLDGKSKFQMFDRESEAESSKVNDFSQSCCFLPIGGDTTSTSDGKRIRDKFRDRRRRPIDSVTTLANLIETLETLKTQTYKKLKEIENINHEIRGMKSSCENMEERHWLRHAEKIMSRQKRFTLRSSQCCFSELKKLAKECNFDKLLDETIISEAEEGGKLFLSTTDANDTALVCSNASGDKVEFPGLQKIDSTPFNFYNSERFSRKAQKLIRSFFEDIKESEEAQINLEKNLLLKKFEKLSKRKSEQSNASTLSLAPGHVYVTKKMMNLGKIRDQFFTEIPSEEIVPAQRKIVPAVKKKNKNFFKISLSGFDGEKHRPASKKGQKRSLFSKSALAWLNNRLNTIHDTSPVIPLRITDIELKRGNIANTLKKKSSKQSVKSSSVRKVVSDEHVRTEVSSYMSESFISEFSDKQSRISRQSRTQTRSIIRGIERSSETRKSEVSIVRIVKDMDANNFFVQLSNSANISSATSTEDSEMRETKFIKRRSRKDIWENGSSTISGFRKEVNQEDAYKVESYSEDTSPAMNSDVKRHEQANDRRMTTSSDSSIVIKKQSKGDTDSPSGKGSNAEVTASLDASVETTADSPRRKKLKLEWKCKSYGQQESSTSELHAIGYIQTECHKVSYIESECQVDRNAMTAAITDARPRLEALSAPAGTRSTDVSAKNSFEKLDLLTEVSFSSPRNESQTETEKESATENSPRPYFPMTDTSVEAGLPTLPTLVEDATVKPEKAYNSENEVSEVSVSPRRSSDTMSENFKDYSFEMKQTVVISSPKESFWRPEGVRLTRIEDLTQDVIGARTVVALLSEPETDKVQTESSVCEVGTRPGRGVSSEDLVQTKCLDKTNRDTPDDSTDTKLKNDEQKSGEYTNLFTVEEVGKSGDGSREISQNELSECNEYDLQTDSNGTMNYNQQKEIRSRDTTPTLPSSDDEKQQDASVATASSVLRVNSQHKPFSAESFNSFKNAYEVKQRKRRQCIKKKSKQVLKKNNSIMRKLSRISGSSLDFTNLTEEEQLRIISANVARFVKQKLVEHKQFFDFEKNETMTFDVEQWSRSAERDIIIDNPVPDPIIQEIEIKPKVVETELEQPPPSPAPVRRSITPPQTPPQPQPQAVTEQEPAQAEETPRPSTPKSEPPPPETPASPPKPPTSSPKVEAVQPVVEVIEDAHSVSAAGDTEKDEKNDPGRQTLDFIKLNKLMAGKYKRRVAPETGKRGPAKTKEKPGKKDKEVRKELKEMVKETKEPSTVKPPSKPASANNKLTEAAPDSVPPTKVVEPAPKPETPTKLEIRKPSTVPARGVRAPSAESGVRRRVSLQRSQKSDIPVPQSRDASGSPRPTGRLNPRSVSATPTTKKSAIPSKTTPTPPLALQNPKQPKKRLIPTYTVTSYLPPPKEIVNYQQRELDKYMSQGNITEFFIDEARRKKYRAGKPKRRDPLSNKNLDYLIMLQKRINHEISANIENSMNYVKTLLSQDYNGRAIIEKAPVIKNSFDVFDSANSNGIVLIEMNDQYDCSSSSSDLSEESGFYCIYQGRRRRDRRERREVIIRRNEAGDSGLVDSPRLLEEIQHNDTDSSYNCEVSIVVSPKTTTTGPGDETKFDGRSTSDILKKYIYHLGGGEESGCFTADEIPPPAPVDVRKKRRERMLDLPREMKRKLLDMLEEEMKVVRREGDGDGVKVEDPEGEAEEPGNGTRGGEVPVPEEGEMIAKISEIVMQYLDEYERKVVTEERGDDDREREDDDESPAATVADNDGNNLK